MWGTMLNYIWGGMIVIGVVTGALTGNMQGVTEGALDSAKEAINLCITMLGIVGFWSGLMEIARGAGLINMLTRLINPFVNFMFPRLKEKHHIKEYIAVNMVSNILGLGWASTPAGLRAMELLAEEQGEDIKRASDEMCTMLVLNISSLQLIPVNIIAYRSQYGSMNPTAVIGPGIVATFISTFVAIVFCKLMIEKKKLRQ